MKIVKDRLYFLIVPLWKRFKRGNKSPLENPRSLFKKILPQNESLLEIGPFYSPFSRGENVKYFDILSYEELILRAKDIGIGIDKIMEIPNIDYHSPTGDLSIIKEKFQNILSSHVIEHQTDLVNHLQQIEDLLLDNGKYFLIIPDKRFCFDHFINTSTIAEVIDSFIQKKRRHSLKSLIEHRALTTHNSPSQHWKGNHGVKDMNVISRIFSAIKEYENNDNPDVHAWYFTPSSFESILRYLSELKLTKLVIVEIWETRKDSFEFFVVLQKRLP